MLEKRRRVVSEAVEKIKEGESLCAKAVDVVATIWGTLLEDDTTEKIRQSVREEDEQNSTGKVEMLKLPLQQNVIKNAEIKIL